MVSKLLFSLISFKSDTVNKIILVAQSKQVIHKREKEKENHFFFFFLIKVIEVCKTENI